MPAPASVQSKIRLRCYQADGNIGGTKDDPRLQVLRLELLAHADVPARHHEHPVAAIVQRLRVLRRGGDMPTPSSAIRPSHGRRTDQNRPQMKGSYWRPDWGWM